MKFINRFIESFWVRLFFVVLFTYTLGFSNGVLYSDSEFFVSLIDLLGLVVLVLMNVLIIVTLLSVIYFKIKTDLKSLRFYKKARDLMREEKGE